MSLNNQKTKVLFKGSETDETKVEIHIQNQVFDFGGLWPVVNENLEMTPFIVYGTKGGFEENKLHELKSILGNDFKYIHNSRNGPFFLEKYELIHNVFDSCFALDYNGKKEDDVNCAHSMMSRSMPYRGFFWESYEGRKEYDYSILTWGPGDLNAKRWDRAYKVIRFLAEQGLTGLVVTQRGEPSELVDDKLENLLNSGLLDIRKGDLSEKEFHDLMGKAKVSIFPNSVDAFPKHMIESLLGDKRIIFATDLLFGKHTLNNLGGEIVLEVDFDKESQFEKITIFIEKDASVSPREKWLSMYSFVNLTKLWAAEFNRVYKTNYKRLFFLNHFYRAREVELI